METDSKTRLTDAVLACLFVLDLVLAAWMVSDVRGEFRDFTVALKPDEKDFTKSTVEATIPVASIDTRDETRDGELPPREERCLTRQPLGWHNEDN
ncbi:MAG: YceI family protein [Deltaproteobacteria bacterium]|nr:YceI family protein [Deltaproteobacteria bacterium]